MKDKLQHNWEELPLSSFLFSACVKNPINFNRLKFSNLFASYIKSYFVYIHRLLRISYNEQAAFTPGVSIKYLFSPFRHLPFVFWNLLSCLALVYTYCFMYFSSSHSPDVFAHLSSVIYYRLITFHRLDIISLRWQFLKSDVARQRDAYLIRETWRMKRGLAGVKP